MEDLIIKYHNGTLSSEERDKLNQWIAESNRNRKVFENIINHLSISQKDVEEAKKNTYKAIVSSDRRFGGLKKQSQSRWSLLKYAAVITFCLSASISIYFLRFDAPENTTDVVIEHPVLIKETDRGQMLSVVLPDGTMVKLNAGSRLSYPARFDNDIRSIELEGEAFFDVKRDEKKPFHVKTNALDVEVLGTSFCISTYPDRKSPLVAVQSGEVLVREVIGTESVSLKQDQYAFLKGEELVSDNISESDHYFGWVNRKLVFSEESVQSIFEKLSRWFDVDFEVSREFVNADKFTGSYHNPSLDQVMRSLSFSYGFNYKMNERMIKIY